MLRTIAAAALAALIAGCGGGGDDRKPAAGRSPATPAAQGAADERPPDLRTACGTTEGLSAKPVWLQTSDGVRLYAVEAGRGATTIVLAHEGRDSLCGGWLPYAARLVRSGHRTLLFDFRGNGESESVTGHKALRLDRDLAAAVGRARAGGARRVFLMGASLGGAAAVQNGASLPVNGIVSLSGTRIWPGFGINHYASLPRLRVPFLYRHLRPRRLHGQAHRDLRGNAPWHRVRRQRTVCATRARAHPPLAAPARTVMTGADGWSDAGDRSRANPGMMERRMMSERSQRGGRPGSGRGRQAPASTTPKEHDA
jgi:pimeloyl-ACP methyl ester carboxylesterase